MCLVFSSRVQQSDDLVEKAVLEHGGPAQNVTECINKYKQNRDYRQPQRQKPDRNRDITGETEITKGANINQGTELETKLGNDGK